jgi:ATP-dependent helicase/DNAse subunit B
VFDNLKVKPSKEGEGLKDQKPNNLSTVVEPGRIPDVRWNALQAAQRIMRWNAKAPSTWRAAVDRERKTERPLLELADKIADHTMLPPELSSSIFLSGNGVSISLLQKYNKCPFLYFAEHVACAKERVKAEDKSNLQGTLLHSLVELATTDLIDRLQHADTPEKISEITTLWRSDVESTDYIRKLYNTATSNPRLRWYALPSSSGSIGERLRFFASKALHALAEFSQEDGYSPRLLEWYFPHSDSEPYVLHVDTLRFTLRGLIDLIEENHAGKVRIIDFKRTSKVFSWLDLSDGTDIQLPLYKLAFETAFPEKKVDELYFCGFEELDTKVADVYDNAAVDKNEIRKKLESQKRRWEPGDVDGAAQFAEKKAMETIRHILTGAFPARPTIRHADFSPCHYCNWRAACGYDLRLARNAPLPRETNTDKKKEILMEITGETEI